MHRSKKSYEGCDYGKLIKHVHDHTEARHRFGPFCWREEPCGGPGTAYQVTGQTGDLFKFQPRGLPAPVMAILCQEHAAKLVEQGLEVVPVAESGGLQEVSANALAEKSA